MHLQAEITIKVIFLPVRSAVIFANILHDVTMTLNSNCNRKRQISRSLAHV